jgi:tetratricopeptide (TPR) repeat protein
MKRHTLLFLSAFTLLFSACDEKLHLPPAQAVDQDVALESDANVKTVLVGAYDQVSSSRLYGGILMLLPEMLSGNKEIRWQGTYSEPREVFNKNIFTNNLYVTELWTDAYEVINTANNVLEAIPVVNEEDQGRVRGEALFLRGSMFFELTRLYGQPYVAGNTNSDLAVPLVLTPTRGIEESSYVSRNTVQEAYTQVLEDLTTAESLLPETNGFFATKAAASAMLSRVYLQMERFADARDAADRAIVSSGKNLNAAYGDAFNNTQNTTEDIFAIQVSAQDGENHMQMFYSIPEFGGRDGDVVPLQAHFNLYEAGDDRLKLFYTGNGDNRIGKWKIQYTNLSIIRVAEMYLTRAEGNLREGTAIGATPLEDLNRIRQRVKLPLKATATLEDILKERKLELAHEGHFLHDVKRTKGRIADNTSSEFYPYDDPRLVFPIPQREIDANSNLVQNEGYGS